MRTVSIVAEANRIENLQNLFDVMKVVSSEISLTVELKWFALKIDDYGL